LSEGLRTHLGWLILHSLYLLMHVQNRSTIGQANDMIYNI